jgi:hypothetical protein
VFRITVRDVPNLVLPITGGPGDAIVWWLASLASVLTAGAWLLANAARRRSTRLGLL